MISFIGLLVSEQGLFDNDESLRIYGSGFTYYDIDKVSEALSARGLGLTAISPITDSTISYYCSYHDRSTNNIRSTDYCTTSAVTNADGNTIGNINLGGDTVSPIMALAVVNPQKMSESLGRAPYIDLIFESIIEGLVCDCWEDSIPGGFETISDWVDKAESMYDVDSPTVKSTITGLEGTDIILEVSTDKKSKASLWTLIILKQD